MFSGEGWQSEREGLNWARGPGGLDTRLDCYLNGWL
jgi:hypothetical protein